MIEDAKRAWFTACLENGTEIPEHSLMRNLDYTASKQKLEKELAKGRKSGKESGWLTLAAVEKNLGINIESE